MSQYALSDGDEPPNPGPASVPRPTSSQRPRPAGPGRFLLDGDLADDGLAEQRTAGDLADLLYHHHLTAAGPSSEQRRQLEAMPCPCAGSFDDRQHCVYVAFLHYNNAEYQQEQCLQDYRMLPVNWLTTKLSGSDIYHCQFFYWNERRRTFVSISVDTYHNCVHEYDKKTFRRGWTFLRLLLPKWQENGIVSFLRAQIGKPMNVMGSYALFFLPMSGRGESYFCSELCVAALHSVGLFVGDLSEAGTSPAALYRAICQSGQVRYTESKHPLEVQSNRQFWEDERRILAAEQRRRAALGKTPLQIAAGSSSSDEDDAGGGAPTSAGRGRAGDGTESQGASEFYV